MTNKQTSFLILSWVGLVVAIFSSVLDSTLGVGIGGIIMVSCLIIMLYVDRNKTSEVES